ncbi:hypothetical protein [Phytoactinopolyspora limicola]|uniref:hypothetical protein n=1 Tax=Phytoactinopolyspora limicola TaxID=2715536 RepID=UPI00140D23B6|nr:hypothetical protein [Phytoactinopolyspora limicola]
MVKSPHEALHRVFHEDAALVTRALRRMLGIELPEPQAISVVNTDLTEIEPIERRADTVLLVEADVGRHLVIIESQTREDQDKRSSWPYYIAFLHTKYRVPVTLLVVCSDAATAQWARKPIRIGLPTQPSSVTYPLVLGPDNVEPIMDLDEAVDDVVLAVFSALTHKESHYADKILDTLASALNSIETDSAAYLAEFVEVGLASTAAFHTWRTLMTTMTYPYQSHLRSLGREEGYAQGRVEGRVEGEARCVLRVLESRGIEVPGDARERIMSGADEATLALWLDRALTAETVEDLFV